MKPPFNQHNQFQRQQEQMRRQREQMQRQQEQMRRHQEQMRKQQEQMRKMQEDQMKRAWWAKHQEELEQERRMQSANTYLQQRRQQRANLNVGDLDADRDQMAYYAPIAQPVKRRSCLASLVLSTFKLILVLVVLVVALYVITSVLGISL